MPVPQSTPRRPRGKTGHQITVPDWVWNWAVANDPLDRLVAGPYLRAVLTEKIYEIGDVRSATNPRIDLPPPAHVPPPPPSPSAPVPASVTPARKGWIPVRHPRTRDHLGGHCWSFSETRVRDLDRYASLYRVDLILCEANGTDVYRVWYDRSLLEEVAEADGTPYYLLNAVLLHQAGDGRVRKC